MKSGRGQVRFQASEYFCNTFGSGGLERVRPATAMPEAA
jgi:hypothetical protein